MNMRHHLWISGILTFLLFSPAPGLVRSVPGASPMTEDDLQAQTKAVSQTLRCAVCQSESVWESGAELAVQMREIIRERLIKGETPDEIRAYFVSRYGDFILLKPRTFGLNWLLWAGPFVMLLIGMILLALNIRKWTVLTAASPSPAESPEISEEERRRIEQEIHSFKN
ncbi:MAG: cytochrome c-type biogenesis protein CcmH [Nitrospirae bacterium]|nr:cytochrome c-type biogenesis protein CcmH [Nitrospirota bacterium]